MVALLVRVPAHINFSSDTTETTFSKLDVLQRMIDEKAQGWDQINFELNIVDYMRMGAEINTTLVDLAFDDIQAQCSQQLVDCVIPSNTLSITVTQAVVNRFIQLQTEWARSIGPFFLNPDEEEALIREINTAFSELVGSDVVLGETRYSQLQGTPYNHVVDTTLLRRMDSSDIIPLIRWRTEGFSAYWAEDGKLAKFTTTAENAPIEEYFYNSNEPGELVTTSLIFDRAGSTSESTFDDIHARVYGNDAQNAGVLVEVVSTSAVIGASPMGFFKARWTTMVAIRYTQVVLSTQTTTKI